jgi:hypothetical protein
VQVRSSPDGGDNVWIETPNGGTDWRLVELRPVSEGRASLSAVSCSLFHSPADFADPPPVSQSVHGDIDEPSSGELALRDQEPVVPLENPPTTLIQWAVLILNTPNPTLKVILILICSPGFLIFSLGRADPARCSSLSYWPVEIYRAQVKEFTTTPRYASPRSYVCSKHDESRKGGKQEKQRCHAACASEHRTVGVRGPRYYYFFTVLTTQ